MSFPIVLRKKVLFSEDVVGNMATAFFGDSAAEELGIEAMISEKRGETRYSIWL